VIVGGDLLPLFTDEGELRDLFTTAARLLAPGGLMGIDATLIDPLLLQEAVASAAWGEDVRWVGADGLPVVRESRLLADPGGGARTAQLQVRHRTGEGGATADERAPFSVRAWSATEVERAAATAGFLVERRFNEDRLRWLLRSTHA